MVMEMKAVRTGPYHYRDAAYILPMGCSLRNIHGNTCCRSQGDTVEMSNRPHHKLKAPIQLQCRIGLTWPSVTGKLAFDRLC